VQFVSNFVGKNQADGLVSGRKKWWENKPRNSEKLAVSYLFNEEKKVSKIDK
jgi:hypothetical protein